MKRKKALFFYGFLQHPLLSIIYRLIYYCHYHQFILSIIHHHHLPSTITSLATIKSSRPSQTTTTVTNVIHYPQPLPRTIITNTTPTTYRLLLVQYSDLSHIVTISPLPLCSSNYHYDYF